MPAKRHIEQEIKLTATNQATLTAILSSDILYRAISGQQSIQAQKLHAFYYDTEDWQLRAMRWSLRTRQEDTVFIAALKRNSSLIGGLSQCEEIEQTADGHINALADLPKGMILDALNAYLPPSAALLPRVEVNMLRHKRILRFAETEIEFVADAGRITGNAQSQALYEIELELLKGSLQNEQVQVFIETLKTRFDLTPSIASKHQLGLSLYPKTA